MPIQYIAGDATKPIGKGPKIVAHIVNDVKKWGKGFVLSVSKKWPLAKQQFMEADAKLGKCDYIYVTVEPDIIVCNMYAQRGIYTKSNPVPLDYEYLDICLYKLGCRARFLQASVHMPRIGCGLAGGTWKKVSPLIMQNLERVNVLIYDFEPKKKI